LADTSPLCSIESEGRLPTYTGRRRGLRATSSLVAGGFSEGPEILCLLEDILARLSAVESEVANVLRAVEPLDDGDAYTEGGSARGDMEDGSGSDLEEELAFEPLSLGQESKEPCGK